MAQGKALHDKACLECHVSLTQGKPESMYTRSDRKVTTFKQLQKRVSYCTQAADVSWSKLQQRAVVEYLSDSFYQFN